MIPDKCENCSSRLGDSCVSLDAPISNETYITCLEYDLHLAREYSDKRDKALKLIDDKKVNITEFLSCDNFEKYNKKFANYAKITSCPKKNRGRCNEGIGVNGWIGCEKAQLTEDEFKLLKEIFKHETR